MSNLFTKFWRLISSWRGVVDEDLPLGDLKAGALYSIYNGDESGGYGAVKILVLEPPIVHIRVYRNTFAVRPAEINPSELTLGAISIDALEEGGTVTPQDEELGFGIGHMPIHLRDFLYGWQPVFLMNSPVAEDELEGYEIWRREGGGVWGGL